METETKLNLRQKILGAMADIGNVPKAGKNTQGAGYAFQKVADMYPLARAAFLKHGIVFWASQLSVEWPATHESRNGGIIFVCHCSMRFALIDTDSDERLEATHDGEAFDTSDKALNKAKTAALKYFLKQTFLIGEDDEDTETQTLEAKRTERGSSEAKADGGGAARNTASGSAVKVTTVTIPTPASEHGPAGADDALQAGFDAAHPVQPATITEGQRAQMNDLFMRHRMAGGEGDLEKTWIEAWGTRDRGKPYESLAELTTKKYDSRLAALTAEVERAEKKR